MGVDPDKFLETLTFLGFLTPHTDFLCCFDPSVGAGKLPALRAVVDGQASLVTPALYPAFPSPPHFAVFGRGGFWITAFTFRHKGLTAAFCSVAEFPVVRSGWWVTNQLTGAYMAVCAARPNLAISSSSFLSCRW